MKWSETILIALVVALSACQPVTSTDPVGSVVAPLEIAEWEGVWSVGEESGLYVIDVVDPDEGRLIVTPPTEEDERHWPAFVRSEDGAHFLSLETTEDDEGVSPAGGEAGGE